MNPATRQHPRFEIRDERAIARGWSYSVLMHHPDASVTRHEVSMMWIDHDYWSGGRVPPSQVVARVLEYLIEHDPGIVLPPSFDLARARRWRPALDRELPASLGQAHPSARW